jgi:hypothetical protein
LAGWLYLAEEKIKPDENRGFSLLNEEGEIEMFRKLTFVCLVLALSVPAYGGVTVAYNVGTGSDGDWKLSNSGHAPLFTTAALNDPTMVTAEANSGGYPDGQMQGQGQLFTPATDIYSIAAISIKVAGMSAGKYGLKIYDLGPASQYTNVQPDPLDLSSSMPIWGDSFTTPTNGVTTEQVIAINNVKNGLGNYIDLYGGEKYAFVITETVSNGLAWIRGHPQTGHMMITTNGGGGDADIWKNIRDYGGSPQTDTANYRTATLALYGYGSSGDFVPEPATIALLGLGGLALFGRRKKCE